MPSAFPPVRTERRVPSKVVVELCSFENSTYEITSTINISLHGASVLTKSAWTPNQRLSIRSVPGFLLSRARIVYCKPLPNRSFSIGLEIYQPTAEWPVHANPLAPPRPH